MKIIHAADYGFRKVIRVCVNPEDPESVHSDGSPHTGVAPPGTDPALKPWEWCPDCRYNWQVEEFVWTDREQYTVDADGNPQPKTNDVLLDEVLEGLQPPPTPLEIPGLVNLDL